MAGNTDQTKGRVKQAVGDLTNDEDLKNEGNVDEGKGKVKDKVDDAKRAAEDAIDKVAGAIKR